MIRLNETLFIDTLFSDLSGTLLEPGEFPNEQHASLFSQLHRVLDRFVLVTGQSFDDEQVIRFVELFLKWPRNRFIAYSSRGGMRWCNGENTMVPDEAYRKLTELMPAELQQLEEVCPKILKDHHIDMLIPCKVLDGTVFRINVDPVVRTECISLLRRDLRARLNVNVESEGRTSIYISRQGVGKRFAVCHELELLSSDSLPAYAGNEFIEGNDREVLVIDNLSIISIAEPSLTRADVHYIRSSDFCASLLQLTNQHQESS